MADFAPIPAALSKRSVPSLPFPEIGIWSGTDALAVLHEAADALFLARHPNGQVSLGRVSIEDATPQIRALTRLGIPDCLVLIEGEESPSHRGLLLRILYQTLEGAGVPVIGSPPAGAGAAPADYAVLRAMAGTILVELCAHQVLPATIVPQALLAGPPTRPEPDPTSYEAGPVLHLADYPQVRIAAAGKVFALLAGSGVRVTGDLVNDPTRADMVLPDWADGTIIRTEGGGHVLTRTRLFVSPQDAAHYALGLAARNLAWTPVRAAPAQARLDQAS